ncbi:MAG TPA: DUF1328 family protein [Methylocella sp.]|nr:DUF1328 family protein [Methylocella sp.]
MLRIALIFLVISLFAGLFGFTRVSAASGQMARLLFFAFFALFISFVIFSVLNGQRLF